MSKRRDGTVAAPQHDDPPADSGIELIGKGVVEARTIGQLLARQAVHISMTPAEDNL